jgi:hypothetical protein
MKQSALVLNVDSVELWWAAYCMARRKLQDKTLWYSVSQLWHIVYTEGEGIE